MLRYQCGRLLRKFWALLVLLVVAAAAAKAFSYHQSTTGITQFVLTEQASEQLDALVEQTAGLDSAECLTFITEYESTAYADGYDEDLMEAIQRYQTYLDDCFTLEGMIAYAQTGTGLVSAEIADDFIVNRQLYASLDAPSVVNDDPFKKFLDLQTANIMPVIILLLVGAFVADSYEKRIHLQVQISKNSKRFFRSREAALCGVVAIFFTAGFAADLLLSGAAYQRAYFDATLQSVQGFLFSPVRLTIAQTIGWLYITQLLSVLITYGIFVKIAQRVCSVKKYLISTAAIITLMSAAAHYIPTLSSYLFAGIFDRYVALGGLQYLRVADCSEATVSLGFLLVVFMGLSAWRFAGYRKQA